eukprot:GILJ01002347.1.p1 GENE.GILJ01002347.1~~GILJ01002347.1.p1  ORF type:complete len:441 (-),score=61.77 GILJ01002347.1:88-1410(-)
MKHMTSRLFVVVCLCLAAIAHAARYEEADDENGRVYRERMMKLPHFKQAEQKPEQMSTDDLLNYMIQQANAPHDVSLPPEAAPPPVHEKRPSAAAGQDMPHFVQTSASPSMSTWSNEDPFSASPTFLSQPKLQLPPSTSFAKSEFGPPVPEAQRVDLSQYGGFPDTVRQSADPMRFSQLASASSAQAQAQAQASMEEEGPFAGEASFGGGSVPRQSFPVSMGMSMGMSMPAPPPDAGPPPFDEPPAPGADFSAGMDSPAMADTDEMRFKQTERGRHTALRVGPIYDARSSPSIDSKHAHGAMRFQQMEVPQVGPIFMDQPSKHAAARTHTPTFHVSSPPKPSPLAPQAAASPSFVSYDHGASVGPEIQAPTILLDSSSGLVARSESFASGPLVGLAAAAPHHESAARVAQPKMPQPPSMPVQRSPADPRFQVFHLDSTGT